MAKIRPFRGIRYDSDRFDGHLDRLVAPPYDVIDDAEQAALYARHPNNIIRLDLNKIQTTDHPENDRYTRSRRHLMDWLAQGVVHFEPQDTLYVHYQEFDGGHGERVTRRGFICLVELAHYDEGIVLPHERTLRGPKEDRLKLMKATECNLSQVFALYDDPDSTVDTLLAKDLGTPDLDITTPDGIRHQLFSVTSAATHTEVAAFFEDLPLLIADGHHRYETALAYRDFRREVAEEPVEDAPYEYFMAFLVNQHDPGLVVFPTHRVVHGVEGFDADAVRSRMQDAGVFEMTDLHIPATDGPALIAACEAAGKDAPSFVLLHQGWAHPVLVKYVGGSDAPIFDEETPTEVRALDVAVLHEGIFDRMLGIDKAAQEAKTNLRYKKKLPEAMDEYADPNVQLVVLMNATPVAQVADVCLGGGKMPQKSTYFYPKILSGLVINPL